MLAVSWADSLSLQCFVVIINSKCTCVLIKSIFLYNFPVCSGVWFLTWVLVPGARTWLIKLWMNWVLCPNEEVYSWLVFDMVFIVTNHTERQTWFKWNVTCQRGPVLCLGPAAVCQLCSSVAWWLHGLLNTWEAAVSTTCIASAILSCSCLYVWILLFVLPGPLNLGSQIPRIF